MFFFYLSIRLPPRSTRTDTLFPYTTLFRSVAILISGRGSNMAALIDAACAPDYPARIALVISNRADDEGLAEAQAKGIATAVIESKGKDRPAFDAELDALLKANAIDLVRSEERRGGKGWVGTCRTRWSAD